MKYGLSFLFAVLLGALAVSTGWAQGAAPGSIVLARVQGSVSVMEKATQESVVGTNGMRIGEGYVVTTKADSTVILVFSNGSTLNLGPDSLMDIEVFLQDPFEDELRVGDLDAEPTTSTTRLNLTRGEVVGDVKRLNRAAQSSFEIRTPAGAAGIRGTTFRITYRVADDGRATFSLMLLDGSIQFTPSVAAGEVATPVTVGDLQEVSVEVTIDQATGTATVTLPDGGFVTVPVSDAGQIEVAAVVQQVVESVAQIVLNPTGVATGAGGGTGPTQGRGESAGEDQGQGGAGTGEGARGTETGGSGNGGAGTGGAGTQPPGANAAPRTTPGDGRN